MSKKIWSYIITMAMLLSVFTTYPTMAASNTDFDGDVIENPWEHLFKDDEDNTGDIELDNPEPEKVTKDTITEKQLKKQLKTKIVSATKKNKKAKKAVVKIKKVKKAKSYQIQYSTSKKFKKSKTKIKKSSKTKVTIKKLKSGKKYYVRVRALGNLKGKKIYGAWSARKVIKVKKK